MIEIKLQVEDTNLNNLKTAWEENDKNTNTWKEEQTNTERH